MERELEQDPSPAYVDAFNASYLLMQQYSELATELCKSMGDTERGSGFKDGRDQYVLEKNDRLPKWLQNKDDIQRDREPERDKDRDDYEPER
jgi:hypothetical protein